jgi:hypothetical protein
MVSSTSTLPIMFFSCHYTTIKIRNVFKQRNIFFELYNIGTFKSVKMEAKKVSTIGQGGCFFL